MTLNPSLKCPVCEEAIHMFSFSSKYSTNACFKCGGIIISKIYLDGSKEIAYIGKKAINATILLQHANSSEKNLETILSKLILFNGSEEAIRSEEE